MGIEKVISPKVNELQVNGELVFAEILDAELDVVKCSFENDSCVVINTEKLKYITLTLGNLETLQELIHEADDYFEDYFGEDKE